MFCNNCGAQLPDESNFCSGCGVKVSTSKGTPTNDLSSTVLLMTVEEAIRKSVTYNIVAKGSTKEAQRTCSQAKNSFTQ